MIGQKQLPKLYRPTSAISALPPPTHEAAENQARVAITLDSVNFCKKSSYCISFPIYYTLHVSVSARVNC